MTTFKSIISLFALSVLTYGYSIGQEAKSLIWEISGNGLKANSYLYGTMHVSDQRVFNFPNSFKDAFESCEAYALELRIDSFDYASLLSSMMMQDNVYLSDLISESDYEQLEAKFYEKTGLQLSLFKRIQPFFISAMLVEKSFDTNMEAPLDLHFLNLAKEQRKKILAIETIEEQINAIAVLSYEDQAEMLIEEMNEIDDLDNMMDEVLDLYIKGDLEGLLKANDQFSMPARLKKALINDRNKRMASRIDELIHKQSTFVAVGALHLPGKTGILKELRTKGYLVRAI